MQDRKTFIAIIVMLAIVLIIAIAGWVKTRNDLLELRSGNAAGFEDELSVCENIQNRSDEVSCSNALLEFSRLLIKYEERLRDIQGR